MTCTKLENRISSKREFDIQYSKTPSFPVKCQPGVEDFYRFKESSIFRYDSYRPGSIFPWL